MNRSHRTTASFLGPLASARAALRHQHLPSASASPPYHIQAIRRRDASPETRHSSSLLPGGMALCAAHGRATSTHH